MAGIFKLFAVKLQSV